MKIFIFILKFEFIIKCLILKTKIVGIVKNMKQVKNYVINVYTQK